jgi:hypothetical protein
MLNLEVKLESFGGTEPHQVLEGHLFSPRSGESDCQSKAFLLLTKGLLNFLQGFAFESLVVGGYRSLAENSLDVTENFVHLLLVHGIQALKNRQFA